MVIYCCGPMGWIVGGGARVWKSPPVKVSTQIVQYWRANYIYSHPRFLLKAVNTQAFCNWDSSSIFSWKNRMGPPEDTTLCWCSVSFGASWSLGLSTTRCLYIIVSKPSVCHLTTTSKSSRSRPGSALLVKYLVVSESTVEAYLRIVSQWDLSTLHLDYVVILQESCKCAQWRQVVWRTVDLSIDCANLREIIQRDFILLCGYLNL